MIYKTLRLASTGNSNLHDPDGGVVVRFGRNGLERVTSGNSRIYATVRPVMFATV
jgi:hypothetical protein